VAARLGDEDVVQRRLDQLQRLHREARLVEGADDRSDLRGAVLELEQHQAVPRGERPAEAGEDVGAAHRFARLAGQRELEVRAPDLGLQLVRRPFGDQLAAGDDSHPVGELVGLLEVLRRQEDGGALLVEALDLLPDRLAADRVEAGGGLVEKEDAGGVDESRGQVETPAHPARVGADAPVGGLAEPDPVQQGVAELAALGRGHRVQRRL
jgi:hypothetical protein